MIQRVGYEKLNTPKLSFVNMSCYEITFFLFLQMEQAIRTTNIIPPKSTNNATAINWCFPCLNMSALYLPTGGITKINAVDWEARQLCQ